MNGCRLCCCKKVEIVHIKSEIYFPFYLGKALGMQSCYELGKTTNYEGSGLKVDKVEVINKDDLVNWHLWGY